MKTILLSTVSLAAVAVAGPVVNRSVFGDDCDDFPVGKTHGGSSIPPPVRMGASPQHQVGPQAISSVFDDDCDEVFPFGTNDRGVPAPVKFGVASQNIYKREAFAPVYGEDCDEWDGNHVFEHVFEDDCDDDSDVQDIISQVIHDHDDYDAPKVIQEIFEDDDCDDDHWDPEFFSEIIGDDCDEFEMYGIFEELFEDDCDVEYYLPEVISNYEYDYGYDHSYNHGSGRFPPQAVAGIANGMNNRCHTRSPVPSPAVIAQAIDVNSSHVHGAVGQNYYY